MPGCWSYARRRRLRVQASAGGLRLGKKGQGLCPWTPSRETLLACFGRAACPTAITRAACLAAALALAACNPVSGPVDLFHDLEGGEIAAQRPPPPGAGQPYPKLGTTPPKPTLPAQAYRNGLSSQLLAERDRTERVAADTPLAALPPPPGAPSPPPAPAPGTLPPAAATFDAADTPPPKPAAPPAAPQAAQPGPPSGAPLTIASDPASEAGAPTMPAAPPPPAAFEGVPAEPAPTPRVLPAGLSPAPAGTQVFFADGSAVLPPNQTQALKDFLSHRRKQGIEVVGLGGAASDTPDGQAAAIELALRRARAVEHALEAQHVPASSIRLSANAFGRGAVLRLVP